MQSWLRNLLCTLALFALAPLAHAQVYRCIGAQGEPVFSGEPCGTPVPAASATGPARRFAGACAASPATLRGDITRAFRTRDVNLLAGLILWRGIDQASARASLRTLALWLQQPLVGISIACPARPPPDVASATTAGATAPRPAVPTGFGISTAAETRDFGIIHTDGCWWLTF